MNDCLVLGIETSCDETSVGIVRNGREVLANVIATQIELHGEYGGVVPELASRKHVESILPVMEEAFRQAGLRKEDIHAVAATYGPGLVGALLVGLSAAKTFAWASGKPLVGVHHIEGHISANYLTTPDLEPPFVCLVASGGHSHIVEVSGYRSFRILGQTRDDAAGEAFDKVSRCLGLGYPGGPAIDKLARSGGNPFAVRFPQTRFADGSLDFSFSGIKTSVINHVHTARQKDEPLNVADIAASFQQAVCEVLTGRLLEAAERTGASTVALAGGVAANGQLRAMLAEGAGMKGLRFVYPEPVLCTDNAAMIACAGYYAFLNGEISDLTLNAVPGLRIGSR